MDLPGLTHSAGQDVGDRQSQPFGDMPSSMVLLGGRLSPSSPIAADPDPSGVSRHAEGDVTCSDAVGRCSLVEGTGQLNCTRNPPKMILELKTLLQLKQYPLLLEK